MLPVSAVQMTVNRTWQQPASEPMRGSSEVSSPARPGAGGTWSMTQSIRIGSDLEKDICVAFGLSCIDKNISVSVTSTVEMLKRGILQVAEGYCVAFSASGGIYYALYRSDRKEAAETAVRKALGPEQASKSMSFVASPMSPKTQESMFVASPMSSDRASPSYRLRTTPVRLGMSPSCAQENSHHLLRADSFDQQAPRQQEQASRGRGFAHSPVTVMRSRARSASTVRECPKPRDVVVSAKRKSSKDKTRILAPTSSQLRIVGQSESASHTMTSAAFYSPEALTGAAQIEVLTPRTKSLRKTRNSPVSSPAREPGLGMAQDESEQSHTVEIANRKFVLQSVIGRGAFGVVWLSREEGLDTDIAVKVVSVHDSAGYASACFEAELLQFLTASIGRSCQHVPSYFAHSASRTGAAEGSTAVVRLAMSFMPGGALDRWLYGISDEEHKTVEVSQLIDGHLPGGQQGMWRLTAASKVVKDMLAQLSSVFEALQPIAFHRDVSSHNVLVDFPGDFLKPQFSLVDFGLAVRSGSWSREWRSSNLAGDPRYWTPCAWMAFVFGFKYVSTHPNAGFQQQYLNRMDHFSVGVLGLETLFALWNIAEAYEGRNPGLLDVRSAWVRYWIAVIHLFQMFHVQGPQEVRQFLSHSQEDGITSMVTNLRHLRQSLRAAASHPLNRPCSGMLQVLADLLDEGGSVAWAEIPSLLRAGDDFSSSPMSPQPLQRKVAQADQPKLQQQSHSRIRSTGGFEAHAQVVHTRLVHVQPSLRAVTTTVCDELGRTFNHRRRTTGYV